MRFHAFDVAMMVETLASGASVSKVARRHDINANLVFKWKRQVEAGELGSAELPAPACEFVPIGVFRASEQDQTGAIAGARSLMEPRSVLAERIGLMEVALSCGTRVLVDGSVDERALRRVMNVLRPTS